MLKSLFLFALLMLFSLPLKGQGRLWPFGGGNKIEKAQRDLEKRQRGAGQGNYFNPLQAEGQRASEARSDFIWPAQSAYLSTKEAGNIGLTTPSRLGLNPKTELQSTLGLLRWVPNLFIKRRIHAESWLWASRHGLYSTTPGLEWAKKRGFRGLVDSTAAVPGLLTISNEVLLSKYFIDRAACVTQDPYLVLSAGFRIDYGLVLSKDPALEARALHFWGSRTNALLGKGWQTEITLRADARIRSRLYLSGSLKYLNGPGHPGAAWEQSTLLQYFFAPRLSVSPGYALSYAAFAKTSLKILPFIDLHFYFGKKARRPSGLFAEPMF